MKIDDIHEMANDINNYVKEHHMLKSLNQQLFDENERLNAIIDELEERINKARKYIKKCMKTTLKINDYWTNELVNGKDILKILGDKE